MALRGNVMRIVCVCSGMSRVASGGSGQTLRDAIPRPFYAGRTIVVFSLFIISMWAYHNAPVRTATIPGYTLLWSYNLLEALRPSILDSTTYWQYYPLYLYLLAVTIVWILSFVDSEE